MFSAKLETVSNKLSSIFTIPVILGVVTKVIEAVLVIFVSMLVIKGSNRFIDRLLMKKREYRYSSERRRNTMAMLLKSVIRYSVYFFAVVIILSIFNIPVASLLAGAGILGLAIGFGAQNLVKDVINGFFVLFEDQFGVSDYVKTAGVEGIVEEIGLRTTSIRDFGGELHIIPNGEITQVTNYSSGSMRVMVDVGVTYEENPTHVIEVLEELCTEIAREKSDVLTEGPRVLGVQELASSSIVIRLWARVRPMEQWQMARYIRQRIKEHLDKTGIEIAYPHMMLMNKEIPELDIKLIQESTASQANNDRD